MARPLGVESSSVSPGFSVSFGLSKLSGLSVYCGALSAVDHVRPDMTLKLNDVPMFLNRCLNQRNLTTTTMMLTTQRFVTSGVI